MAKIWAEKEAGKFSNPTVSRRVFQSVSWILALIPVKSALLKSMERNDASWNDHGGTFTFG